MAAPESTRLRRALVTAWLHLAVLWAFAFAQPLFQILADSPEFFVARGNTRGDILLLAFGLVLVPPTLLIAVELVFARDERLRQLVHLVLVGLLAAALALQLLKEVADGPSMLLLSLGAAFGVGAALVYARTTGVPTALTLLAPAPAVFLGLFLVASPVSDLFGSDDDVRVKEGVRAGAPVVMLVLDEFSVETLMNARGGIDPVRFPSFAALAKSATWYRNATTVSNHTTDAVPAVLSGRFPRRGALPIAADHPRSIFTLLGGAYSLRNVDEPSTDLCPERLCGEPSRPAAGVRLERLTKDLTIVSLHRLLPGGLADRLPPVDLTFGDFADQDGDDTATEARGEVNVPTIAFDDRPGQFERFIGGLDGESRTSSFNFLHVLLPHTPWQYLPSGRRYPVGAEAIPGLHNGIWTDDPSLARQAYQRYVLQVGYVDRLVGRLLRRMRAEGLYDRALLVIVADHGISFRPGTSRRSATGKGAADILGVPLFIKVPHQRRGRVDDGHATTADVLPTVADALGIALDWRLDGRSLLDRDRPAAAVGVATFRARKRLKMPFSDYVRDRDAEVLRTQRRLGDAHGWASVYAAGPDSVLFGRRAAELRSGALPDAQVRLDDAEQFAAVRPRGPLVPAFVRGRLSGTAGPGLRLAVAVNGTVRAVTHSYEDGGQTRLGSLVPLAAFRPGANDVQIYEISGQGRSRRLRLIHRQS